MFELWDYEFYPIRDWSTEMDESIYFFYVRLDAREKKLDLRPAEIANRILEHLGWLKEEGLFDYHLRSFTSSNPDNKSLVACAEEVIDEQLQWESLSKREARELIKSNLTIFRLLGYRLSSLEKWAGSVVYTYAIELSVGEFINGGKSNA